MRKKLQSAGFSLVEVTMAIGLMSFCLVAMLGMLPVGMSQERKSMDQMLALQALTAVATDFKGAPVGSPKTGLYDIDIPMAGETAKSATLQLDENFKKLVGANGKQFEVVYKLEPPSSAFSSYRLSLRVYRTSQANPSTSASAAFVEGVVLKPGF